MSRRYFKGLIVPIRLDLQEHLLEDIEEGCDRITC